MSTVELSPDQLQIILYPHIGLRHMAKPIKRVDETLRKVAERMIDLMYEHRGVGLAATQVNVPLRMFVWNPTGSRTEGQARVFLNPTITRPRSNETAEEGCLSLPGLNADVIRAKTIHVHAFDMSGQEIDTDFSGYEARIIQHETDHLNGALFIDRLTPQHLKELESDLAILEVDFQSRQRTGSIPTDEQVRLEIAEWERRYA